MKLKIQIAEKTVNVDCPECNAGLEINAGFINIYNGRDLLDTCIETCGRWAARHVCGEVQSRNGRTNAMTKFFNDIAGSIYRMSYKS